MKKSDLVARTMYAYARGNEDATPALLLDLRLWKHKGSKTNPDSWEDSTGVPGARQGRSGSYSSTMRGYLVIKPQNWQSSITVEQIAALEVPLLPEDSREAARVIAGLDLPDGIGVDLVMTSHLRSPWDEHAKKQDEQKARAREARIQRQYAIEKGNLDWEMASRRLARLGVEGRRLTTAADEADEPRVRLTLTELNKLLDLAEGTAP